jgi:hypothetical protein
MSVPTAVAVRVADLHALARELERVRAVARSGRLQRTDSAELERVATRGLAVVAALLQRKLPGVG